MVRIYLTDYVASIVLKVFVEPHPLSVCEFFFFLGFDCRYEQSEFIERELEQMTEQIKLVIQTLNSSQVSFHFNDLFVSKLFEQILKDDVYFLVCLGW